MACQVVVSPSSRSSFAMLTGVTAGSRKLAAAATAGNWRKGGAFMWFRRRRKFLLAGVGTVFRVPLNWTWSLLSCRSFRRRRVEIPEKVNVPRHRHAEVTHTLPPQKLEIFKTLEKWAESDLLPHLKPVDDCWQPQDFLPDPTSESFHDEVAELRRRSRDLPDDYLVCLVGDLVTEEALPTYQTFLNNLDGIRDETGASLTPWAVWTRAWTAEENRHGDLLNKYLYLTGRVDMRKIEKTIQYLTRAGMDFRTENSPYSGFIYTSFQERATSISHGNTARLAKAHGDAELARICGTIAADEKRHEAAYAKIVEKLFEVDPDGTVLAFADRMRKKVSMPACLMFDGRDGDLFAHFSAVAQRVGVYTAKDYADILQFLIRRWKVEELPGLSPEGRAAQEFLCGLAPKIRRVEERAQAKAKSKGAAAAPRGIAFSWIFDREVQL
ncbi:hypothetical protein ZIOFF_044901 [Zingiber officinale]|uniref:Acyl-[acyl-carrier-protein] desaturase n=1 Tax=Zingiber officinale TaxID=94328 RepID=A0A8J5FZD7_ZINOF|nr:hypothetical protein ZIOFF_044901 [Zingiber officinale]